MRPAHACTSEDQLRPALFMWISGCLCYAGKSQIGPTARPTPSQKPMTRFGAAKHAACDSEIRAVRAIPAKHPQGLFPSSTSRVSDSTSPYSRWPLKVSFLHRPRTTTLRFHNGNRRPMATNILLLAFFVPALFAQTQTQPVDIHG